MLDYILIEDKLSLVPCGAGESRFWGIYYEDLYVGVAKTMEMAICNAAIVINDAVVLKLNTE
ncbi:hypothetical protein YDYSY3_38070 [Paenibacillus chitinolyticus]|nr:hypothetical protein YDYSY3_38070 [Paenibacillus chitinolyticus]